MLTKLFGLPYAILKQVETNISLPRAKKEALMNSYNREESDVIKGLKICLKYLSFMPIPERQLSCYQIEQHFLDSFFYEKIIYMIEILYSKSQSKYDLEDSVKGRVATTILLIYTLEEHQQ